MGEADGRLEIVVPRRSMRRRSGGSRAARTKHRYIVITVMVLALNGCVAPSEVSDYAKAGAETQRGDLENGKPFASQYSGSYALVIGESKYTAGWPSLPTVDRETRNLEAVLRDLGFEVTRVADADSEDLEAAIDDFIQEYGQDLNHRLLIFFGGHGYTETTPNGRQIGYLVPTDAPFPARDLIGFRRLAISMYKMEHWALDIHSKHAVFLFDSCFAGTIFQTRSGGVPERITTEVFLPVRFFITAGGANDLVPAVSFFTPFLIDALKGRGDLNGDRYITGTELGAHLTQRFQEAGVPLKPHYGAIQQKSLRKGDFVFVLPSQNNPEEATLWEPGEEVPSPPPPLSLPVSFPPGLPELRDSCDSGEAASCTVLGTKYAEGRGVDVNPEYAAWLFSKGCNGGDPHGCTALGRSFRRGEGTPRRDNGKAVSLYRRGCDGGDVTGCRSHAEMLRGGLGVPKDPISAVKIYQEACLSKDVGSCLALAEMYLAGEGAEQSLANAMEAYRLACEAGDLDSCGALSASSD